MYQKIVKRSMHLHTITNVQQLLSINPPRRVVLNIAHDTYFDIGIKII
jgi:hypothetical protein